MVVVESILHSCAKRVFSELVFNRNETFHYPIIHFSLVLIMIISPFTENDKIENSIPYFQVVHFFILEHFHTLIALSVGSVSLRNTISPEFVLLLSLRCHQTYWNMPILHAFLTSLGNICIQKEVIQIGEVIWTYTGNMERNPAICDVLNSYIGC